MDDQLTLEERPPVLEDALSHILNQFLDDDAQSEASVTMVKNYVALADVKLKQDRIELDRQIEEQRVYLELLKLGTQQEDDFTVKNVLRSDRFWTGVMYFGGIMGTLYFEKFDVIASKAWGLITKVRL